MGNNLYVKDLIALLLGKTKCSSPQCRYENINSNNYCVKCGRLLPSRSTKVVINSIEYESLKKKANMSVWGKIKEKFTKENYMARTCSNCYYSNSNTSHYCVQCGEPLEKTWMWLSKPDKEYEVIAKTELDSLRNERDSLRNERNRLQKQINDSWGIKIENWIKDNIKTIGWTIASIFAFVFVGFMFIKCDFFQKASEVIEIRKDEASGKYGIYNNESNTLVTPYEYDSISHRRGYDQGPYRGFYSHQGVYVNFYYLYRNGKIGVADSTGKATINCSIDAAKGAYNGVVILQKGEKKGLMDVFGHQIIPCEYQYVLWKKTPQYRSTENPGPYVGNIIPVAANENSGWELYNRDGRKISNQRYKEAIQTGNPRLIKVREYRKDYKLLYGVVDENGQVVIPCKYYSISVFGNDRAWVKEKYNDSWSLITSSGERLVTFPKTYTPSTFYEGMAAVEKDGKIGYCDISGNFIIPIKYEKTPTNGGHISWNFYNGKAYVSYNGKPGYLDRNGIFHKL